MRISVDPLKVALLFERDASGSWSCFGSPGVSTEEASIGLRCLTDHVCEELRRIYNPDLPAVPRQDVLEALGCLESGNKELAVTLLRRALRRR